MDPDETLASAGLLFLLESRPGTMYSWSAAIVEKTG